MLVAARVIGVNWTEKLEKVSFLIILPNLLDVTLLEFPSSDTIIVKETLSSTSMSHHGAIQK